MNDKWKTDGVADSDLTEAERGLCYEAWTIYRDGQEALGECSDIVDFRTGFKIGYLAGRQNRRKKPLRTHCRHGHEYTPENTGQRRYSSNRYCKACRKRAKLEWHHRQKAASGNPTQSESRPRQGGDKS